MTDLGSKWNRPKPLSDILGRWVCVKNTAADTALHGQCGTVGEVLHDKYVRVSLLTDHGPRNVFLPREDVALKERNKAG